MLTRSTLERILDILDLIRINQVQLYMEPPFAYSGRDASPLTAQDVRWFDGRCAERGLELVADQNAFGHIEHWSSRPARRHRAEMPDGFKLF